MTHLDDILSREREKRKAVRALIKHAKKTQRDENSVYVVTAEHHEVPGLIVSLHKTYEGAVKEACDITQTLVNDTPPTYLRGPRKVTANNYETIIHKLQDIHGAQHCYVDITEKTLQD